MTKSQQMMIEAKMTFDCLKHINDGFCAEWAKNGTKKGFNDYCDLTDMIESQLIACLREEIADYVIESIMEMK